MKFSYYDAMNRVKRPALSVTWISLLTEDEEMVSQLGLREYQMRFGAAHFKMGGIDGVGTKEEHRNKGYSRRVMEHTTAFMTENGFDVAMLFGIPNFYPKFGYATVIPETWIYLEMGRRSIEDFAIDPDVSLTQEIIPVLETLFPLGHLHVWWPDRF